MICTESTVRKRSTIPLLVATIALSAAPVVWTENQQHDHGAEVGAVAFPVSCNTEAQTRMNRAVAMLHS
jgi:hypothetical protein